jgi:hypothetical protein
MNNDIKEIKEIMKDWFQKIEDKYVTKTSHDELKNKTELLYKVMYWVVWLVFTTLISTVLFKLWIWSK